MTRQLSELTVYTKANYEAFISKFSTKADGILASLLENDSTVYISNIDSDVIILATEEDAWPITLNYKEYSNALLCSPYATYVKCAIEAVSKFDRVSVKCLLLFNALIMSVVCRLTKINQVAQVNNTLNSLLKHPECLNQRLSELTEFLTQTYPKHTIAFFRVNDTMSQGFLDNLKKNGYLVFPDRKAHIFFPGSDFIKRSHTKRDLSLLRNTNYTIVHHNELTEKDAARISELYHTLFVKKHSKTNPVYTEEYFRRAIKNEWHHYTALRHPNGKIDAFIAWFYRDGTMLCGPLGYDTAISSKVGLYRMLVGLCLKHANEEQLIFNMGAGSDTFKSNRGSTMTFEYTAVYCKHLPFYRRIPWKLLSYLGNKFTKKILDSSNL